jgi:hypothetical protein
MDEPQTHQPNPSNQSSNQSNKPRTDDVPGTSRDPTGRVISDKSSQGNSRQDQGSRQQRSGSDQRGSGDRPETDGQKRS